MVQKSRHGGVCCGVTHIHNFVPADGRSDSTKKLINNAVKDSKYRGHMYEIVLTDQQLLNMPDVAQYLKASGFKLVSRFFNANSGNYCNVLHLHRNARGSSPWDRVEL